MPRAAEGRRILSGITNNITATLRSLHAEGKAAQLTVAVSGPAFSAKIVNDDGFYIEIRAETIGMAIAGLDMELGMTVLEDWTR
jgi:hypothetical protein